MTPPAGTLSIQDAAKILSSLGIVTGPTILFEQLRRAGVLMSDNLPYQKYIPWFRVKQGTFDHGKCREVYCRTFITESGLQAVRELLQPPKPPYQLLIDRSIENMNNLTLGF